MVERQRLIISQMVDPKAYKKAYYEANKHKWKFYEDRTPEEKRATSARCYAKKRREALERLGGAVCVSCGCTDERILEINHKKGGGCKEQKRLKSYFGYVNAIAKGTAKNIKELNVMCRVCNALHYVRTKYGIDNYKITWNNQ